MNPMNRVVRFFLASVIALSATMSAQTAQAQVLIPINTLQDAYYDEIATLYPADGGLIVILAQNRHTNQTTCHGGREFWVSTADQNYEVKASALTAAFLSGRRVSLLWDSKDSCRAHINRFHVD
jgi:ABC-type transport system substrate-binding protein